MRGRRVSGRRVAKVAERRVFDSFGIVSVSAFGFVDFVLFSVGKNSRGHWSVHSLKPTAKGPENGWWEDIIFLLCFGLFLFEKPLKLLLLVITLHLVVKVAGSHSKFWWRKVRDNDSKFFPGGIQFLNLFGGDHMIQSWEKWPVFKFHPWSFHSSPLENDGWIWSVYVCLRFTPAGFCSGPMLSFRGVYGEGKTASRFELIFCSHKFVSKLLMFTPPPLHLCDQYTKD